MQGQPEILNKPNSKDPPCFKGSTESSCQQQSGPTTEIFPLQVFWAYTVLLI